MPDDKAVAEPAPLSAIVELDRAECLEILHRQRMCVLSVVDGDEPYAVPVYYGFDGEFLYLGVADGRKTRALERNPRVHIVIAEPGSGDSWRSVAIAGRATTLTEPAERARGVDVLIEHNRRPERGPSRVSSVRRRSAGRILRIDDATITGRARR